MQTKEKNKIKSGSGTLKAGAKDSEKLVAGSIKEIRKEEAKDDIAANKEKIDKSLNYSDVDFSEIDSLIKSQKINIYIKRAFDFLIALLSFLLLWIFFVIVAILIRVDSSGGAFYKQIRVGKNGKRFKILKFRTMVSDSEKKGMLITVGNDSRITRIGKFLRKSKLDELPQIINIIKGDMSFVGPRPEVPKYTELYTEEQKKVLLVRPGITDIASIEYRNESEILALSDNPEKTYIEEIMPRKLAYNMSYLENISIINDVKIIFITIFKILR